MPPPVRSKGKGKAPVTDLEEPASELEYDEDPFIEESDDSGSEFMESEEEKAEEPDSEEDEALMLSVAVQSSLETARRNAPSSSSARVTSVNPAAILRAAAAERRLALANAAVEIDVNDYPMTDDDPMSGSDADVPLFKPVKGKKANKKKQAEVRDTSKPKHMTMAQLRKQKREARQRAKLEQNQYKAEENALKKKLGRKLTNVSSCIILLLLC